MNTDQARKPLARSQGIVTREVGGELLIYDLHQDKAHCLNQTAALVWKSCDGHRSVEHIAKFLENHLQTPVDERIVWYALEQLDKDRLLEGRLVPPSAMAGMHRRDMIRALGLAAIIAVPVVTSIVAPTPAQASSCKPSGVDCPNNQSCCSGLCNNSVCA